MPGAPVPGVPAPVGAFPPPAMGMTPGMPAIQQQAQPPVQTIASQAPYVPSTSRAVQKSGQVHVYADSDVSYEEKRAKNPKYAQTVAQIAAAPVSSAPAPVQVPAPAQQTQALPPQAAAPASAPAEDANPRVTGTKRARAADLI